MPKATNVGTVAGETCSSTVGKNIINTQNQKSSFNPYALKDFENIKSFKDGQSFVKDRIKTPNSSSNPNWIYISNPTKIKVDKSSDFNNMKNNNTLKVKEKSLLINKENYSWVGNSNIYSILKENICKGNSLDKQSTWTPITIEKNNAELLTTKTKWTTLSKNSNGFIPNVRIKRSSSKKNRTNFFCSVDDNIEDKKKSLRLTHSNNSRDKVCPTLF